MVILSKCHGLRKKRTPPLASWQGALAGPVKNSESLQMSKASDTSLPPLLGFLWREQAPAGATVPPRSRRVCPKVRCVTRSWSPCKVERRIWVSAGWALPASILASRTCLPPSLLTNIPWLRPSLAGHRPQPCFQGSQDLAWARLAHLVPPRSAPRALLSPLLPALPDLCPLPAFRCAVLSAAKALSFLPDLTK